MSEVNSSFLVCARACLSVSHDLKSAVIILNRQGGHLESSDLQAVPNEPGVGVIATANEPNVEAALDVPAPYEPIEHVPPQVDQRVEVRYTYFRSKMSHAQMRNAKLAYD